MLLFGINQNGNINDNLRVLTEAAQIQEGNLSKIRSDASNHIEQLQSYNKQYYDKKHTKPTTYKVGDFVMITNHVVTPGVNRKLLPKFKGPYVVKKVLDNDRYVVCDIEGFQLTQIPYEGIICPDHMKHWS